MTSLRTVKFHVLNDFWFCLSAKDRLKQMLYCDCACVLGVRFHTICQIQNQSTVLLICRFAFRFMFWYMFCSVQNIKFNWNEVVHRSWNDVWQTDRQTDRVNQFLSPALYSAREVIIQFIFLICYFSLLCGQGVALQSVPSLSRMLIWMSCLLALSGGW